MSGCHTVESTARTATSPIIALAGNPNVGKSTLFNALTGSHQHVGNWPGKTVEQKTGTVHIDDHEITFVDLPGTYSLNAFSADEIITRDFLINDRPRLVIAVVDAANLERNLFLVTQLLELEAPLVLALNMTDTARKRGLAFDLAALSERLGGIPVVETVGSQGEGLDELRQLIAQHTGGAPRAILLQMNYGPVLEGEISVLQEQIAADPILSHQFRPRWLAIKLLENDEDLRARLASAGYHHLIVAADEAMTRIAAQTDDDSETLITDVRYQFIAQTLNGIMTRTHTAIETASDKVDRVIAHPIWGMPIFLLLMWIVFQFTANVSAPMMDWIDGVFGGPVTHWVVGLLELVGLGGTWVEALLADGVIAGVGGVLVFVPVMMSLYFAVSVLEDTGYMARSAFVMDGIMRRIGLHGKSFLPLMVGFGCNVPAVYATRTLENENDRKLTGFLLSFISCGARLPVYV
ncbi:MAG: ferrous iron transport protein B, partial [Anaerolineae bacterium]|nr:ferrous iron transport protein B [Anaerolineae bacterium]